MSVMDSVVLVTALRSFSCRSIVPDLNVVPVIGTVSVQLANVPTGLSPTTVPSASTARTRPFGRAPLMPKPAVAGRR